VLEHKQACLITWCVAGLLRTYEDFLRGLYRESDKRLSKPLISFRPGQPENRFTSLGVLNEPLKISVMFL